MSGFVQIEGDFCIMVDRGVYKQCDLYQRDGFLYAKVSGGFVRLMSDGSTSKSHMRLDHLVYEGELLRDQLGKLCTPFVRPEIKTVELEAPKKQLLIGTTS